MPVTLLQLLFFIAAAAIIGGAGLSIIWPAFSDNDFSQLSSRLMLSFAVKMVLGAATLLISWKLIGWPATGSAIGSVSAYLGALFLTLFVALKKSNRGSK